MKKKSILVVDDERSIRATVKIFLEEAGFCVHIAKDAEEALAVSHLHPVDLVLSDIILPRVSGVDLLRQIRQLSPDVQVIMMTGEPAPDTAAEAQRLGAVNYLQKPVGKNDILKAVRNALNIRQLGG